MLALTCQESPEFVICSKEGRYVSQVVGNTANKMVNGMKLRTVEKAEYLVNEVVCHGWLIFKNMTVSFGQSGHQSELQVTCTGAVERFQSLVDCVHRVGIPPGGRGNEALTLSPADWASTITRNNR